MILAPEVYDQPLPPAYRADVHAVYRNAKHLQNLINDVLDISQLEARHLAIVKEKAEPGRLPARDSQRWSPILSTKRA